MKGRDEDGWRDEEVQGLVLVSGWREGAGGRRRRERSRLKNKLLGIIVQRNRRAAEALKRRDGLWNLDRKRRSAQVAQGAFSGD